MSGDEGFLTLAIRMRVSPEPEAVELLKKYRDALNYAIRWVVESSIKTEKGYRVPSLGRTHNALYEKLKAYGLPSRIALDCYREARSIAKSYLGNGANGRIPRVRTLRMWLTPNLSYRIKNGHIEVLGGCNLRIIGWDRRYDAFESREARLVYKNEKMFLMISKRIPMPEVAQPKGIIAVDVNEKHIYYGNKFSINKVATPIDRALHYRKLAENLQRKYSSEKNKIWIRRRDILNRIRYFQRKSWGIIEDWAKKASLEIAKIAKQNSYAVAREDLNGLIESLRKLPKDHKVKTIMLSYRRFDYWIDWQAQKHGVGAIIVDPAWTSSECPICGSRMVESGYRKMKCPACGFEADRDVIAVMNIEKKALKQMGGSLTTLTALQMTDVDPNRCGEPVSP